MSCIINEVAVTTLKMFGKDYFITEKGWHISEKFSGAKRTRQKLFARRKFSFSYVDIQFDVPKV